MIDKAFYDVMTSKARHTNSNGAFARAADGSIHFVFSRSINQNGGILCQIQSLDGGESWSKPEALFSGQSAPDIVLLPSLLTLKGGGILIAYVKRNQFDSPGMYVRASDDEGMTWACEFACTPTYGYYLSGNDRLVQTSSGRVLLPVCCHTSMPLNLDNEALARMDPSAVMNPYGIVQIYYSDDGGQRWKASEKLISINVPSSNTGLQEPGLVETRPGLLMCFARTDLGRQYESFSTDDGLTWSQPEPSRFTSSCSPAAIKRREADGLLVAVWNPIPSYVTLNMDALTGRQRLVCAVSKDCGKTWSEPAVLEDDPSCEFSHPALLFSGDYLIVAYNVSPVRHARCFKIRIRKIALSGLM